MGVNRVILVGYLGENPTIRYLEDGGMRAAFSLATSGIYKNKEGAKVVHTEWHNVVLWSKLAETAVKYLVKGKQIYLEGRIAARSYISKKDGQVKYITEIVGQNLVFLSDPKANYADEKEDEKEKDMPLIEQDAEEDLFPF